MDLYFTAEKLSQSFYIMKQDFLRISETKQKMGDKKPGQGLYVLENG